VALTPRRRDATLKSVKVARRLAAACCAVLALIGSAGCGKKGPPLAPYVLLPAAPVKPTVQRAGNDVFVSVTLPQQNIDASKPADVRRLDIYAYTATTAPPPARALELATRVAVVPVAAAPPEGALLNQRPHTPAVKQAAAPGATITVKEVLTGDAFVPKALPTPAAPSRTPASRPGATAPRTETPGPPRRYYIAIAFSDRGQPGPQSAAADVALAAIPDPPGSLSLAYTPDSMLLSWEPSGGIVGFLLDTQLPIESLTEDDESAKPMSDPLGLPPGPTRYHVYREQAPDPLVLPPPVPATPQGGATVPKPLTSEPLSGLTFTDPVEFDRETCYDVRAVRGTGPEAVESAPSERRCVTAVDVFPPAPPTGLSTTAGERTISLIWESSPDADVAGYLVLRGSPSDATLLPLTAAPVLDTQYTDTTVTSGMRYVYAVVAVDARLPVPNVSAESERIEETAR